MRNIIKYLVTIIEETLKWLTMNKYHIKGKHSAVITTDPPQLNNSVLKGGEAPNQEIEKNRLYTHSVGGRPLHNDLIPSRRTMLTNASCRDSELGVSEG